MDAFVESPENRLLRSGATLPDYKSKASLDLLTFLSTPHWLERKIDPPELLLGAVVTRTTRFFLGGPTGLGKTQFVLGIAAGMVSGQGFLHWKPSRRCKVLYIDGEMSRDLIQERLSDLHRRIGKADLSDLYVLCNEDCELLAKLFPELGKLGPLNTVDGQEFILQLVDRLGGVDAIILDNRMSLLSGDMKEEQPWSDTMPLVKELTSRRIAQIWVDHTGHNPGQLYGTKTKEWQFDSVALMTKAERAGADIAFTLEFTKARRRKPSNRSDFDTVSVAMIADEWTVQMAQLARNGGAGKMQEDAVSLLRHIENFIAEGLGTNDRPEPGMPLVPTLSRGAFHAALLRQGWLRLSERLSKDGSHSESVSDAEYGRLWKRLTTLKNKGIIGFNRQQVWLAKPARIP